jgi:hypothetical protein
VLSTKNISLDTSSAPSLFFGAAQSSYLSLVLKNGTLVDWAKNVSSTGHASLKFSTGASHRLFAFYQFLSHEKNLEYSSGNAESIWDNGSYVVDHYSAQGAQVVAKFWEKYILPDGVKDLLKEVGNYGEKQFQRYCAALIVNYTDLFVIYQAGRIASRSGQTYPGLHRFQRSSNQNMVMT